MTNPNATNALPVLATPERAAPLAVAPPLDLTTAINAAVGLGKDGVEVLERLHAILKDQRADQARAAYFAAMAAFRAEMPPIVKCVPGQHGVTRVGTRTRGMFTPLDAITKVLDPIAARHGLTYRFDRSVVDGKDYVVCFVSHVGGHVESARFPAPADTGPGRNAIQAIASGETYAKRYALIAAFAITTADPDEDGEDVSADLVTEEQAANLRAMLDEFPDKGATERRFLGWLSVKSLAEIPASRYGEAVRQLERKRKEPTR